MWSFVSGCFHNFFEIHLCFCVCQYVAPFYCLLVSHRIPPDGHLSHAECGMIVNKAVMNVRSRFCVFGFASLSLG